MTLRAPLLSIWIAAAALGACAATPDPATIATIAVPPSPPAQGAESAPTSGAPQCESGLRGQRCEGLLGAGEASALGPEIAAAQKAILDSQYTDVRAMVRLAKLQLRRDQDITEADGATDAARALRNAARAVAVDASSAEARLSLTLALARSLQRATSSADPAVRSLALDLVGLSLRGKALGGPAPVLAAAATLEKAVARARSQSGAGASAHLGPEPLAPPPPPPPRCSPGEAAAAASAAYCAGLTRLAVAASRADREEAASAVIDGWRALEPLCESHDPACPPHVAEGLAAASRGFEAAGKIAKAIASAKLVLEPRHAFPVATLDPMLSLEIGDRYYLLGVFDQAADWYERAGRQADAGAAARAKLIRKALGAAAPAGQPSGSQAACAPPLACTVRRLAGEAW
jgi:hypothetical protein